MRVELRADLNAVVAQMVRPKVDRLAEQVAEQARRRAPDAKRWATAEDEKVRPAHALADGQTIPENLRYKLRKQYYEHGGGRGSKVAGHFVLAENVYDMGREPRDEDLPADQAANCRCQSVAVPGVIAERIRAHRAQVEGPLVRAVVDITFTRIIESEHGTSKDHPARFLGAAVQAVAARLRR